MWQKRHGMIQVKYLFIILLKMRRLKLELTKEEFIDCVQIAFAELQRLNVTKEIKKLLKPVFVFGVDKEYYVQYVQKVPIEKDGLEGKNVMY